MPPRVIEARMGTEIGVEIARTNSEGSAGRDLYPLFYGVARACGPAYESLVAGYLIHPEDPEVSALAVQVLTGHWRVGAKYRKQMDRGLCPQRDIGVWWTG